MPKISDWVKESVSGTPGTGTITLGGAVTGFCRFQDAFATGNTVIYTVEDGNNKELGIGTLTTGAPWTLARTTILRTISSGTYDDTSPVALTLTSAAIVGIADTMEGAGIVVGTAIGTITTAVACPTLMPIDDTIPQNTEGDEIVTVSYTPKFADSILQIQAYSFGENETQITAISCAIFRDSVADALAANYRYNGASFSGTELTCYVEEVSGSTTARTYKFRAGPHATGGFNANSTAAGTRDFGGVGLSYIKVTEIRQ